jgi:hypothetical protein
MDNNMNNNVNRQRSNVNRPYQYSRVPTTSLNAIDIPDITEKETLRDAISLGKKLLYIQIFSSFLSLGILIVVAIWAGSMYQMKQEYSGIDVMGIYNDVMSSYTDIMTRWNGMKSQIDELIEANIVAQFKIFVSEIGVILLRLQRISDKLSTIFIELPGGSTTSTGGG